MTRLLVFLAVLGVAPVYAQSTYVVSGVAFPAGGNPGACAVCGDDDPSVLDSAATPTVTLDFTDATPPGCIVTGIAVTLSAIGDGVDASTSVSLNSMIDLGTQVATADACGSCGTSLYGATDATGLALWSYNGGTNTLTFDVGSGVLAASSVNITVTYVSTLAVDPTSSSVPPSQSIALTAQKGDTATGYTWSSSGGAGGTFDTTTGSTVHFTVGTAGTSEDVFVTDGTTTVQSTISVGPGITIDAPMSTVLPGGTVQLTATGGEPDYDTTTYTYSIDAMNSSAGGTVDASGLYTAPMVTGGADTILAKDALGNVGQTSISVGGLALSPAAASIAPNGSITFSAVGGSTSAVYTYAFATDSSSMTKNPSGGTISTDGVYVAGPIGSTPAMPIVDTITVTDGTHTGTAQITVTQALSVSPNSTTKDPTTPPRGTLDFTVTGGKEPYAYAVTVNHSGLDAQHDPSFVDAEYSAGPVADTTDTLTITDANSVSITVKVDVGDGITIDPTSATIAPKATLSGIKATGGDGGPYTWSVQQHPSGGNFSSTTPTTSTASPVTWIAGATGGDGTADTIAVKDSLGNTATLVITITDELSISPQSPSVAPSGTLSFSGAGGGDKSGYLWTVASDPAQGGSGGTITGLADGSATYTAGPNDKSVDVITLTDALGNTTSIDVSVGGIAITVDDPSVYPGQKQTLSAKGGTGTGYTWSFASGGNQSGGTIDASSGVYVAGTSGITTKTSPTITDTLVVTDSSNSSVSTAITVAADVSAVPAIGTTTPGGEVDFSGSGGSGTYKFAFAANGNRSGGTIDPDTGVYFAGQTLATSDTIVVSDPNALAQSSTNDSDTATVNLGPGVSITSPTKSTPPLGTLTFKPAGGNGKYGWSITTNVSHGMVSSSGVYVAGTAGGASPVQDVVTLTDSNLSTATVTIEVTAGVTITPAMPTAPPKGSIAFQATGGSGTGYKWRIASNGSLAIIDAQTGVYTAGDTPAAVDQVSARDSLGNVAQVSIAVGNGLTINPTSPAPPPKGSITFTATGGSKTGYTWSLASNASGGTIDAKSGAYLAGEKGSVTDIVKVTDANGITATVKVPVGAGLMLTPPNAAVKAGATLQFSISGGSGNGYVFALTTNASGASVTSTGVYVAGPTTGSDVLSVVDSLNNSDTATIMVAGKSGTPLDMGAAPDASVNDATMSVGDLATAPDAGLAKKSGGCGCTVGGAGSFGGGWLVMLLALVLLVRRRA